MPRKRRRLDLAPPGPSPSPGGPLAHPPPPADTELIAAAQALLPAARVLDSVLLPQRQRLQLRHKWTQQTPAQALRLAQLLSTEGALFAPLPFDAAELCAREERVRRLLTLKELLDHLSEQAADLLLSEKAALHDQVQLGTRAVCSLLEGPLVAPAIKERLRPRAEPLLRQVAERRDALRRTRRRRAAAGAPEGDAPGEAAAAPRLAAPAAPAEDAQRRRDFG